MKFKALRTKKEPKEFVELINLNGEWAVYTGDLPHPQPLTSTIEMMKKLFAANCPLPAEINLDDYELIEFEMFEVNTVGADIRNKLSPSLNLISLLRVYFNDDNGIDGDKKKKILQLIKKEMAKSKKNIQYISNLL